ncbi:hypothetical protein [Thioalkalivibrio sp. ALJ24]|uniref:hypothetical protein n=1 Tax=Thioalkalivibrio sp. ALJ24 TaxID=545276 RepID=UPI0003791DC0|nr:hypothetical protein [Thioalkalivibrio sp. ALJ24]
MSDLQNKLAAGVRAARENQDNKGEAAAEDKSPKTGSDVPASGEQKSASRGSTASSGTTGSSGQTAGGSSGAAKKPAAKKPAAKKPSNTGSGTRKGSSTSAKKPAGGSRRGGGSANDDRATGDAPWDNLHPDRVWPD